MKELELAVLCWCLACAYQTLFTIILYPQKEENASGSIPAPAAGPVAEPERQQEAETAHPHLALSSSENLKCLQKVVFEWHLQFNKSTASLNAQINKLHRILK